MPLLYIYMYVCILKVYEIQLAVSNTPSLLLAWKARKKKHFFFPHFFSAYFKEWLWDALKWLCTPLKFYFRSPNVFVSNKTCALTNKRQATRSQDSPNAPLASLSAMCECLEGKLFCRIPAGKRCHAALHISSGYQKQLVIIHGWKDRKNLWYLNAFKSAFKCKEQLHV